MNDIEKNWQARISLKEIYRYMGMKERDADASIQAEVEKQLARLLKTVRVRSFCQIFPLCFKKSDFTLGPVRIQSRDLRKNLSGCDRAALFGVTLGLEVDRLIYRLGRTALGEAAITDACAAAAVEAVCDELCEKLREEARRQSRQLRPRFSPGFGDFTLAYQPCLLQALNLSGRIGVCLTDGGMMTPTKSVTAVVGLTPPDTGERPLYQIRKGREAERRSAGQNDEK